MKKNNTTLSFLFLAFLDCGFLAGSLLVYNDAPSFLYILFGALGGLLSVIVSTFKIQ